MPIDRKIRDKTTRAYALQAESDLKAYNILCDVADSDQCQRAHYLQMCFEKFCKAYVSSKGQNLKKAHNYIADNMPDIYSGYWNQYQEKPLLKDKQGKIQIMCKELDLLCPKKYGHDVGIEKNCEYPWVRKDGAGNILDVLAPCTEKFFVLNHSQNQILKPLIKCVEHVIRRILEGL